MRRGKAWSRSLSFRFSSSLTRRIVVLNLGGLVALAVGFLYVNQFREGLIDARVQSLQTQGEIIAAADRASASVDTDAITIDPEKLLQLAPGHGGESRRSAAGAASSPSIRSASARCCAGSCSPTRTRARIFDRDGYLLLDSRSLSRRGIVTRYDLPALRRPKTR